MIIDFHTHISPPHLAQDRSKYLQEDPYFGILYGNPKAKIATAEDLIASMDVAGVDVSVITNFGWVNQATCIETNDYLLESAAKYPGRLVAFCMVQPKAGDAALREIERCATGGARGLGEFMPDGQGFSIADVALLKPVMEEAKKHDLLFMTHASEPLGHDYPGKGRTTPEVLYKFITAFAGHPIILAHWGGGLPLFSLMPEVEGAMDGVYFDSAASPFLYKNKIFRYVAEIAGVDKVLMGSDYPLIGQGRMVKLVSSLDLDQEHKELILGENARILLERHGGPLAMSSRVSESGSSVV